MALAASKAQDKADLEGDLKGFRVSGNLGGWG